MAAQQNKSVIIRKRVIELVCKSCNSALDADARFCDSCGKPIAEQSEGNNLKRPSRTKLTISKVLKALAILAFIIQILSFIGNGGLPLLQAHGFTRLGTVYMVAFYIGNYSSLILGVILLICSHLFLQSYHNAVYGLKKERKRPKLSLKHIKVFAICTLLVAGVILTFNALHSRFSNSSAYPEAIMAAADAPSINVAEPESESVPTSEPDPEPQLDPTPTEYQGRSFVVEGGNPDQLIQGSWQWNMDETFIYFFEYNGSGFRGIVRDGFISVESFEWMIIDTGLDTMHLRIASQDGNTLSITGLSVERWNFGIAGNVLVLASLDVEELVFIYYAVEYE